MIILLLLCSVSFQTLRVLFSFTFHNVDNPKKQMHKGEFTLLSFVGVGMFLIECWHTRLLWNNVLCNCVLCIDTVVIMSIVMSLPASCMYN